MPYGLSQAGVTFQRLVDKVIGPELEPFAFPYLDDIIIATEKTQERVAGSIFGRNYVGPCEILYSVALFASKQRQSKNRRRDRWASE